MPTSVPASEPRNALGGGTVNIASELSWRESEREDVMQSFALFLEEEYIMVCYTRMEKEQDIRYKKL